MAKTSNVRQLSGSTNSAVSPASTLLPPSKPLVCYAYSTYTPEPDAMFTVDGAYWAPVNTPALYDGGAMYYGRVAGTYTGDRFMVPIYDYYDFGTMLQSFDGIEWEWADEKLMLFFDYYSESTYINDIKSGGSGMVWAGGSDIGDGSSLDTNNYNFGLAKSSDFGETWEVCQFTEDEQVYTIAAEGASALIWWTASTGLSFTSDGGANWTDVEFPDELSMEDVAVSNGTWFLAGYGFGSGLGDTPLWRSSDPRNGWEPVLCPWSGYYPPSMAVNNQTSHSSDSGTIYEMFKGPEGRLCALGYGTFATDAYMMFSDDSGVTWTELGTMDYDNLRTDFGYSGVYLIPDGLDLDVSFGAAFAFDRWWIINYEYGGGSDPNLLSITSDFKKFRFTTAALTGDSGAQPGVLLVEGSG